ncbi:MAG TPA: FKBP-type peptidyl-prolyl cis-trans isomerase [Vicinamibacteria bacterium]|nr:FKBP-type peptidyl-prolyl cis-trans isomerase [Vicinamibacteria bacterium]
MNRLMALSALVLGLIACSGDGSETPGGPTSLEIEDLNVGTGAAAAVGDTVTVNYVGMFLDGRVFDPGAQPITFRIGSGALIPGFEQGVVGMRVGGRRRVTIPSSLAYGASGQGPIPPNTPIRFEITLVSIAGQ